MKRMLDILGAAAGLVLLCPVLLFLTLLVWWGLGRPVFFIQQRPGFKGVPFKLIKFRTMRQPRATGGTPLPDELRMTRLGTALRKMSLDELPELFNVLKGDMSLVGPRPLLMDYLPLYTPEQRQRHDVKPGLTGWAQVNGRNATSWEDRLAQDVWYVEHQSLRLDGLILLKTIGQVVSRKGVQAPNHVTMPRFRGNDSNG